MTTDDPESETTDYWKTRAEKYEARSRWVEAERDDLAREQGRYLQEWQQMKAERERLLAERDQWKAGTLPGWTRDDVYKDLADKYRELEAERDRLRSQSLDEYAHASPRRQAAEWIAEIKAELEKLLAERNRRREEAEMQGRQDEALFAAYAEADVERERLRGALERVIEELQETSEPSGRGEMDFEQKATNAAAIARQALDRGDR
jgi:hypothetical protein